MHDDLLTLPTKEAHELATRCGNHVEEVLLGRLLMAEENAEQLKANLVRFQKKLEEILSRVLENESVREKLFIYRVKSDDKSDDDDYRCKCGCEDND